MFIKTNKSQTCLYKHFLQMQTFNKRNFAWLNTTLILNKMAMPLVLACLFATHKQKLHCSTKNMSTICILTDQFILGYEHEFSDTHKKFNSYDVRFFIFKRSYSFVSGYIISILCLWNELILPVFVAYEYYNIHPSGKKCYDISWKEMEKHLF